MTHLRIDFDFGADATVESVQLLGATLTAEFGVPVAGPPGTTDYTQLINKPAIPQATSQTPVALGGFLALVGSSSEYARADHKHSIEVASIDATELRSHLNVADGAERNVNADWTATSGDAQILNKPSTFVTILELSSDEPFTILTAQLPALGIITSDNDEQTFTINLPTPTAQQSGLTFSIKRVEGVQEPNATFYTLNHAGVALVTSGELDSTEGSVVFTWDGYRWVYDAAYLLRSFPGRVLQLPAGSGAIALTSLIGSPCEFIIACSDESSHLTTGPAKVTFRAPYAFTLTGVRASVNTAPTGSTLVVDINEAGTSVLLSTKLSIDVSEKTSTTAASAPGALSRAIADDAEITIDIVQGIAGQMGKGLKVVLIGTRA